MCLLHFLQLNIDPNIKYCKKGYKKLASILEHLLTKMYKWFRASIQPSFPLWRGPQVAHTGACQGSEQVRWDRNIFNTTTNIFLRPSVQTSLTPAKAVMEDFWLPRVSGAQAAQRGKKGGKQGQFQHVVGSRAYCSMNIMKLNINKHKTLNKHQNIKQNINYKQNWIETFEIETFSAWIIQIKSGTRVLFLHNPWHLHCTCHCL